MTEHLNMIPSQLEVVVAHHGFKKRNTNSISISNNFNELSKSYKNIHFQVIRVIKINFIDRLCKARRPKFLEKLFVPA